MISPMGCQAEIKDSRLSVEFEQRLARYMGECDPASAFASRWVKWYEEHAGTRSDWFRQDLIWRLEFIHPLAGRSVLDFGCGTGSSSVVIAEKGATVVGVETEQKSIDVAAQRARDLGVGHRCTFVRIPYLGIGQGGALPFHDASFDVCTLIGVLEHMKPDERLTCAAEIDRVLKPGGDLFIFDTPNRAHPFDHHTTLLWFIGWMPRLLARQYAILRKRFDRNNDFQRYGGNGLSRNEIDGVFPRRAWRVTYEKSLKEVAQEFGWLARRSSILPASFAKIAESQLSKIAQSLLNVVKLLGCRPTYWTASHTFCLTKLPKPYALAPSSGSSVEGRLHRSIIPPRPSGLQEVSLADLSGEVCARIQESAFIANENSILLGCQIQAFLQSALDVHNNRVSRKRCRDQLNRQALEGCIT